MQIRILIADDNASLRKKVRDLLESRAEWTVVGEAANGREAVRLAAQLQPDVMILDYSMPELDGISAIREIHRVSLATEVVLLTIHDAQYTVGRAVEAGARGYVVKSLIVKDLMPAVEAARQHKTFLSFLDTGPKSTADRASTSEETKK